MCMELGRLLYLFYGVDGWMGVNGDLSYSFLGPFIVLFMLPYMERNKHAKREWRWCFLIN